MNAGTLSMPAKSIMAGDFSWVRKYNDPKPEGEVKGRSRPDKIESVKCFLIFSFSYKLKGILNECLGESL